MEKDEFENAMGCFNEALKIDKFNSKAIKGNINSSIVDPRSVFRSAIVSNSASIIVAHNHPSGNLNPSESDNKITQKIKEAGNLLDIQLLDHIILTTEGDYYSYADNGIL